MFFFEYLPGENVNTDSPRDPPLPFPSGFGELSLLYRAPRSATIKATTDVKLWVLHSKVFNQIQRKWQEKENQKRMELINSVKMMEDLDMHQRELLCDALDRVEFKAGDVSLLKPFCTFFPLALFIFLPSQLFFSSLSTPIRLPSYLISTTQRSLVPFYFHPPSL